MRKKLPGNILIHQSQLASQYKRRASKTSNYSTMSHNGSAIRQDPRHKSALNQKEKQKETYVRDKVRPTVFPVYRPYMETTPTQGHYLGHHHELKYSNDHETDDQADDVID